MKKLILFFLITLLVSVPVQAEEIGTSELTITVSPSNQGMELVTITKQNIQLLAAPSPLFSLRMQRIADQTTHTVSSTDPWETITPQQHDSAHTITFSNPQDPALPNSLRVTVTIEAVADTSRWHLAVAGTGPDHSLTEVIFPDLYLRAPGNDWFLIPKYSGVLLPDPVSNNENRTLFYPRGWSATMQFCAYYNDQYGIYLGAHDPKASLKSFILATGNTSLHFKTEYPVPDKTRPGNDWQMDGYFALRLFTGDWYDAALMYRQWASQSAAYWPRATKSRMLRQESLARLSVWGTYMEGPSVSMDTMRQDMNDFISFFQTSLDIGVGIHWYRWNYKEFDDDYPDYFPERNGMTELVQAIQARSATIMPYINGRLYDTDLTGAWEYATRGHPHATKKSSGEEYTQEFNSNTFAVMCPTRDPWQEILRDAASQLTGRIGARGLYLDQICAAGPTECMDPDHGHPLGGGHWWRDGYRDMLEKVHDAMPAESFIVVEGAADYLADQVDGFLTDGWQADNLVPAFQAIYGGRVQLVGKGAGSAYHDQSFYSKLAQALVHNVVPGRFFLWFVHDTNADTARPFVHDLVTMRHRLQEYLAFGTLLHPLRLSGQIPAITSTWRDYGNPVSVTTPAIQTGLYRNPATGNLMALFINSSVDTPLSFSFTFNGQQYDCRAPLSLTRITPVATGPAQTVEQQFSRDVSLAPLEMVAFEISGCRHSFPWPLFMPAIKRPHREPDID